MTSCCKICRLEHNKEYCVGCGRTVYEIQQAYLDLLDKKKKELSEKNGTLRTPSSTG